MHEFENLQRGLFNRNKPNNPRNPVASVALAPGRALFLAMVNMNIDGIATKLAKQNFKTEIEPRWLKAGGNPSKLSKAINKGKGKRPKKVNFLSKFKGGKLAEDVYLSEELNEEQKKKIIALSTSLGTTIGTAIPGIGSTAGAGAGASLGGLVHLCLCCVVRRLAILHELLQVLGQLSSPLSGVSVCWIAQVFLANPAEAPQSGDLAAARAARKSQALKARSSLVFSRLISLASCATGSTTGSGCGSGDNFATTADNRPA